MSTTTPHGDAPSVVLHQEQVQVGVEQVPVRAVVRRRVVTEVRSIEVTVRREVFEVEYTRLAPGTAVPAGQVLRPIVLELAEEVPVVTLETRPYERVLVEVEDLAEQAQISTSVAGERAEVTTESLMPEAGA